MKHFSSSFFANRDCEYYPCHTPEPEGGLNCLFCFCPLYDRADCGGDYVRIHGVKDCSRCLFPHRKENYAAVLRRLAGGAENGAMR